MPRGPKHKPGPDPERLNLPEEDWEKAVERALRKKKPKEGWPEGEEPEPEGDEE